jgi:ABC-type multidrug transport system ATPase subunit
MKEVEVEISKLGKRYNHEWIFRNIDLQLTSDKKYVVLGANGSGKSTFLQLIAGNMIPSEGSLQYKISSKVIEQDDVFKKVSYAAPYLDLFEDLTLIESVSLHQKFKPFQGKLTVAEVVALTELEKSANKQLRYFSSGMKQRLKLALAILSDSPMLLLDEPASNLDKSAISWYQRLVGSYSSGRLVIVASNQLDYEYPFCDSVISIGDYKKVKS